jgi:AraC family transcriptional regulator of adaptative response/methylated-DNA-[protein]-cysteine methyltransferase
MRAEKELKEYFSGRRNRFDVPLVLTGTDYQKKVWRGLMEIPYGTTRSYGEQAKLLSDPKAVRAVASANGQNRIAIIVPCHRVIGADGKLVGYGGGLHRKQFLLDLELEHAG